MLSAGVHAPPGPRRSGRCGACTGCRFKARSNRARRRVPTSTPAPTPAAVPRDHDRRVCAGPETLCAGPGADTRRSLAGVKRSPPPRPGPRMQGWRARARRQPAGPARPGVVGRVGRSVGRTQRRKDSHDILAIGVNGKLAMGPGCPLAGRPGGRTSPFGNRDAAAAASATAMLQLLLAPSKPAHATRRGGAASARSVEALETER